MVGEAPNMDDNFTSSINFPDCFPFPLLCCPIRHHATTTTTLILKELHWDKRIPGRIRDTLGKLSRWRVNEDNNFAGLGKMHCRAAKPRDRDTIQVNPCLQRGLIDFSILMRFLNIHT
jgi:hypothetical protein